MPSHQVHRAIDKLLTGKEHPEVHRYLDRPAKFLGPGHRVLRHSLLEVAMRFNPVTQPEEFISAVAHIELDKGEAYWRKRLRGNPRRRKR